MVLTSKVTFTLCKSTGRANASILFYTIDLYNYCLSWMGGIVANATVIFSSVVMYGTKKTFRGNIVRYS